MNINFPEASDELEVDDGTGISTTEEDNSSKVGQKEGFKIP
jgi:hypothetical protein